MFIETKIIITKIYPKYIFSLLFSGSRPFKHLCGNFNCVLQSYKGINNRFEMCDGCSK